MMIIEKHVKVMHLSMELFLTPVLVMLAGMALQQVVSSAILIELPAVVRAPQIVKHVRRMPSLKGPSQTNVSAVTLMGVLLQMPALPATRTVNIASSLLTPVVLNVKLTHL
jgi:hypothetical protein